MEHWGASRWASQRVLAIVVSFVCFAVVLVLLPVAGVPVGRPPMPKWPGGIGSLRHAVVLVAATENIREALAVVREERKRTRAEREAFAAFADRVETTAPLRTEIAAVPRQTVVGATAAGTDQLRQLRTAYGETVMAVPHYAEEYDDTVAESLAGELGPEIASQLVSGRAYTPQLQRHLLAAIDGCRRDRAAFLATLDAEAAALETARSTLASATETLERLTARVPSARSIGELIAGDERLAEVHADCEDLLADRQRQRTRGHAALDTADPSLPDLQSYLYGACASTYPVLADATTLLGACRRTRRQLARELAARY